MKRKVLLLALSITFILTSCSSSGSNATTPSVSDIQHKSDDVENASLQEKDSTQSSSSPSAQAPTAYIPLEETSQAVDRQAPAYVPGILSTDGYESEWLGVRFTAPQNTSMIMPSAETEGNTYEMFCSDNDNTANVYIMVENLPANFQTMDTFVAAFSDEMENETDPSYSYLSGTDEVLIGSNTYRCVSFCATYNGAELYQTYFFRVMESKLVSFVITYTDSSIETAGNLISAFEAF